ncbi:C-type lectin domain family 2 member B-like [Pyxicephalus adspersus]|uniref:C-type lectin domain family 2 member B-like n=1 Tax=Pyxicephalus adspersus TaxID=30357 RepID=UPI003B58E334
MNSSCSARTLQPAAEDDCEVEMYLLKDSRGKAEDPDTDQEQEEAQEEDDPQNTASNSNITPNRSTPTLKDCSCGFVWWKTFCKKYWICGAMLGGVLAINIIIISIFFARQSSCKCPSCPNKWTKYDDMCYFLSNNFNVWKQSQTYCKNEGGSLLIINDTVLLHIKELFNLNKDYWIGLTKDHGSGEWKWVNGSVYMDTVMFGKDSHLNCGYINGDIGALDCSSQRPWICMKSIWSLDKDLKSNAGSDTAEGISK